MKSTLLDRFLRYVAIGTQADPYLFGGFYNAHGPYEFAVLEEMNAAADVIIRILEGYGRKQE
jgi:di/tripeptidase